MDPVQSLEISIVVLSCRYPMSRRYPINKKGRSVSEKPNSEIMAIVVDVLIRVSKRVVFVLSWSLLIFVRQCLLVLVESANVFLHHLPADRQFGVKGRRHRVLDLNECPIRESPLRARARLEYESRREKASMSAHANLGVNRFHFDGQGTSLDLFCPECNDLFPDVFRHMMDVHDCVDKLDCLVILYRHEKQYMNVMTLSKKQIFFVLIFQCFMIFFCVPESLRVLSGNRSTTWRRSRVHRRWHHQSFFEPARILEHPAF